MGWVYGNVDITRDEADFLKPKTRLESGLGSRGLSAWRTFFGGNPDRTCSSRDKGRLAGRFEASRSRCMEIFRNAISRRSFFPDAAPRCQALADALIKVLSSSGRRPCYGCESASRVSELYNEHNSR
jgi:hypothetical protein